MFNNKVAPDQYQKLRQTFFDFCSSNGLTINEASDVINLIECDMRDQVCSGVYGKEENISCP